MFSLKRNKIPRGCFIVFCGLDGSGKSTLMEGVNLWLKEQGIVNVQGRHPPDLWFNSPDIYGKYVLGRTDDNTVDDHYEVDFTCNLRKELQNDIITSLFQKNVVMYHRYIYSLFAYYYAVETVDMDYISKRVERLLKPDLVFYSRIDVDKFYERSKTHGILPFQEKRENISRMIEIYDRFAEESNWTTINTVVNDRQQALRLCIEELNKRLFDETLFDLGGENIGLL